MFLFSHLFIQGNLEREICLKSDREDELRKEWESAYEQLKTLSVVNRFFVGNFILFIFFKRNIKTLTYKIKNLVFLKLMHTLLVVLPRGLVASGARPIWRSR